MCDTGFALAVHIRYTRPTLLYQTYAQDWIDFYSENGLMLSDPIVHWGLRNNGAVAWDATGEDDPAGVLAHAERFGLRNGMTIAVGPPSSRTIAGVTRSDRPFSADEMKRITALVTEIHEITNGFDDSESESLDALRHIAL